MTSEATQTTNKAPAAPVGAPCWIEILGVEPEKLKDFYAAVFPAMKIGDKPTGPPEMPVYHIKFDQPSGLTGGIMKLPPGCVRPEQQPMGVGSTVYYFVPSIDEIEKQIVGLGGKKVLDKTAEGENGWFANFVDPEGNRFGVYEVNSAKCG